MLDVSVASEWKPRVWPAPAGVAELRPVLDACVLPGRCSARSVLLLSSSTLRAPRSMAGRAGRAVAVGMSIGGLRG